MKKVYHVRAFSSDPKETDIWVHKVFSSLEKANQYVLARNGQDFYDEEFGWSRLAQDVKEFDVE